MRTMPSSPAASARCAVARQLERQRVRRRRAARTRRRARARRRSTRAPRATAPASTSGFTIATARVGSVVDACRAFGEHELARVADHASRCSLGDLASRRARCVRLLVGAIALVDDRARSRSRRRRRARRARRDRDADRRAVLAHEPHQLLARRVVVRRDELAGEEALEILGERAGVRGSARRRSCASALSTIVDELGRHAGDELARAASAARRPRRASSRRRSSRGAAAGARAGDRASRRARRRRSARRPACRAAARAP